MPSHVRPGEQRMALALVGRRPSAPERDPTGQRVPRGYLFEDLFVKRYDELLLDGSSP